jgi:hypothetical protein
VSTTAHPRPVPRILQLGVAAAGGLAVLAAPRVTLLVGELVRRPGAARQHAARATSLR